MANLISILKRRSTSTANITSTPAAVSWDTSIIVGDLTDWIIGNPTRLPVLKDGLYNIKGFIAIASTGTRFQCAAEIYVDGSTEDGIQRGMCYIRNSSTYDFWPVAFDTDLYLLAGQYVEIFVGQTDGATYGYSGSKAGIINGEKSEVILRYIDRHF